MIKAANKKDPSGKKTVMGRPLLRWEYLVKKDIKVVPNKQYGRGGREQENMVANLFGGQVLKDETHKKKKMYYYMLW